MEINYSVILAYVIGIFLLFLLGRVLLVPLKIVLRLVYNALLGAICIIAVNFIGSLAGFHIALNVFTSFIVGFLGIPGLILIVVLKLIFKV